MLDKPINELRMYADNNWHNCEVSEE